MASSCKETIAQIRSNIEEDYPDRVAEAKRHRLKADLCAFWRSLATKRKPEAKARAKIVQETKEKEKPCGRTIQSMLDEIAESNPSRLPEAKRQKPKAKLCAFFATLSTEKKKVKPKTKTPQPKPPPRKAAAKAAVAIKRQIGRKATATITPQQAQKLLGDITNVLGPISISIYQLPEEHKTILIFGELHEKEYTCKPDVNVTKQALPTNKFFETLALAYPQTQFDFFLEAAYKSKRQDKYRGYLVGGPKVFDMGRLIQDWEPCLRIAKEDCQLPDNARAHYVDIRDHPLFGRFHPTWMTVGKEEVFALNLPDTIAEFLKLHQQGSAKEDLPYPTVEEARSMAITVLTQVRALIAESWAQAKKLYSPAELKGITTLDELWFKALKIGKQIDAIKSPTLRREVLTYWNVKVQTPVREAEAVLKKSNQELIGSTTADFIKVAGDLTFAPIGRFLWSTVYLMDTYTIARMLRSFQGGRDPEFIGYYAGDAHSENIREFFIVYLNLQPLVHRTDRPAMYPMKCISVKGIDWNRIVTSQVAPTPQLVG